MSEIQIIKDRLALLSVLREAGFDTETSVFYRVGAIGDDETFVAISCDEPAKVSYARTPTTKYDSARRVKTTFRRYCSRVCKLNTEEPELNARIEAVERKLRILGEENKEDSLLWCYVEGEEISERYRSSFACSSCMTNHRKRGIVKLYADNPKVVRMLIVEGEIEGVTVKARALAWKLDGGDTYADRIYTNVGHDQDILTRLTDMLCEKTKGDFTYYHHSWYCGNRLPNDESVTLYYTGDTFPYADTFRYGISDSNKYTLYCCNNHEDEYIVLECTDGNYETRGAECCCSHCGTTTEQSYADNNWSHVEGEIYCEQCYQDLFFYCEYCESEQSQDDYRETPNGSSCCQHCFDRNFTCCDNCNESIDNESVYHAPDGSDFCEECYCEHVSTCEECESEEMSDELEESEESQRRLCSCCLGAERAEREEREEREAEESESNNTTLTYGE